MSKAVKNLGCAMTRIFSLAGVKVVNEHRTIKLAPKVNLGPNEKSYRQQMVERYKAKVVKPKPKVVEKSPKPKLQWRPKRKTKSTWSCTICDLQLISVGLFWLHVKVAAHAGLTFSP